MNFSGDALTGHGKGQKNILVFRTGQLGDTIVGLPAIYGIRERFPNHRLILLTPRSTGNLVSPVEVLGATDLFWKVIFYSPPSFDPRTWFGLLKLVVTTRRLKPDAFFYLRDFPHLGLRRDIWFFQVLCGMRNAFGMSPPTMSFGQRDALGKLVRYQPESERLLSIALDGAPEGFNELEAKYLVPISCRERIRVDSLWRQSGLSQDDLLVAFGPGSKMAAKRWPLARFIEVGRDLLRDFGYSHLVIVGGVEDAGIGEEIRQTLGNRVLNMAGELSVLESAEALRRCALYVGNDSGAMHLAAAVGTPCVAIFSARDHPGRWDPWGRDHIVLRKDPQCAGCLLEVCTEQMMACLKEISTKEVYSSVLQILAPRSANSKACVQ